MQPCCPDLVTHSGNTHLPSFSYTPATVFKVQGELADGVVGYENDSGVWWAAVYEVSQSWTRLMRLSSSSSSVLQNL